MKKISKKIPKIKASSVSSEKVLEQMIDWAFECGKILNSHLIRSYHEPLKILDKGKQGLATEADLFSEKFVMDKIKKHYPDHKILSEEDSFKKKIKIENNDKDEYLWLIDPLDGTNNFYNKVPFFSVSLALNKGNETLVGIVFNPVTCELFYAVKGKGAYLIRLIGSDEVRVRLKTKKSSKTFKEALLSGNLIGNKVNRELMRSFPEVRAMRRFGSAALELSYVAAGMLDAYWEYQLQPWDLAAAGLICQEAGVKISTIEGKVFNPFSPSVLAAHPTLYPDLLLNLKRKK